MHTCEQTPGLAWRAQHAGHRPFGARREHAHDVCGIRPGLGSPLADPAPGLVLSEQTLQSHHELALQFIYGDDFYDNEDDVVSSAVLGSWAKPTLLALVLWTLTEKLAALTGHVPMPDCRGPMSTG